MTSLKRMVRRLIPDRWMARLRLHQHSRQVRTNVDVLVADRRQQRRWLTVVPDTYRVIIDATTGAVAAADGIIGFGSPNERAVAIDALSRHGLDAVVVGETSTPRLVDRRRVEPVVRPRAIAARRDVLADVGGGSSDQDLVALHDRLRDAGHHLGLIPVEVGTPVVAERHDPIVGPAALVISGVPMHDVGGGSRASQLTQELVRRGCHVVFAALFGTHESTDLGIRYVHPRLEQRRMDEVDPAALARRAIEPGLVIVEMPVPGVLPVAETLASEGWRVVYDVIDRWSDPALGGDWYDARVEDRIAAAADVTVASASDLMRDGALLVPNAADVRLFRSAPGPIPDDFPAGEGLVFGYHGSLYGDWFDWTALQRIAEGFPDARLVVIGDVPRATPPLPGNVHLLGLKPQRMLPAYVTRFDVGLLPFVVSETTHAVSPLKVFEYLVSGVRVAAPPLRALDGLGVSVDPDPVVAVHLALQAPVPDPDRAAVEHSWKQRVDAILDAAGFVVASDRDDPVRVEVRPAIRMRRAAQAGR